MGAVRTPLARLLALAYRSMIDDLHTRLAARAWENIRPAYGFVLLAVRDEPLTPTALATQLDVTKQAASKLADAMVTDGLLTRVVDKTDSRRKLLALTPRGVELLAAVESIYAELEAEWAESIGPAEVDAMRTNLADVLHHRFGEILPAIRPTP